MLAVVVYQDNEKVALMVENGSTAPMAFPMPQTWEELAALTTELQVMLAEVDASEATRRRAHARADREHRRRIGNLPERIQAITDVLLLSADEHWEKFNAGSRTPTIMRLNSAEFKKDENTVGSLKIDHEETVIAFARTLPNPDQYLEVVTRVRKNPLKKWYDLNRDRRIPGAHLEYTTTVSLTVQVSAEAARAGVEPHRYERPRTRVVS